MKWISLKQVSGSGETVKTKRLVSAVLFVKDSYIKKTYGVVQDVSETRDAQFRAAMGTFAARFARSRGIEPWPEDTAFALFVDARASDRYKDEIDTMAGAARAGNVRFLVFEFTFKSQTIKKLDKVAMLVRFIPVFAPGKIPVLAELVYVIDMDSYYTNRYFEHPIPQKADVFNFESVAYFGLQSISLVQRAPEPFVNGGLGVFRPWTAREFIDFPKYLRDLRPKLVELDIIRAGLFESTVDTQSYLDGPHGFDEIVINDIVRRYPISKYTVYLASKDARGHLYVRNIHKFTTRLARFLVLVDYGKDDPARQRILSRLRKVYYAPPDQIKRILAPLVRDRKEFENDIPKAMFDALSRVYLLSQRDRKMLSQTVHVSDYFIVDVQKVRRLETAGFIF